MGEVLRIDATVRRPSGEWTPAVQLLLAELRAAGLDGVPEPLGLDEEGREVLSFIDGENLAGAAPEILWSTDVLRAAGAMLRGIHDAGVALVGAALTWRSPTREPAEVICHNDFATYNLIVRDGELVGAIDFDFAAPGPRLRDLAYLAYKLVPYASDSPEASAPDRDRRLELLLDAYGSDASPDAVREAIVAYLGELEAFTRDRADETGRRDLLEHAAMYRRDAQTLRRETSA
ncbi:phosphotransferase [Agromyces sp. MMS24-JH15]|uniref:phosphotransferase n=1 Tax=Agromyces sp. MMS24-JH15 TaxID=3243765 RepID=UPI0037496A2B